MLTDLLAGLMKLSGKKDGNKCLKNNIFTFSACYSFKSSCSGSRSTRCTDILSNKKYQKSYNCSVKSWRAREVSLPSQFAGGHWRKSLLKRAIRGRKTKRRYSSVRSGNEEDGNGKEWEKSSQIWLGGNLFVKETSQYLTCFEKARLPAFLISGLLAFEIAQLGILKFWCVLFAC